MIDKWQLISDYFNYRYYSVRFSESVVDKFVIENIFTVLYGN